METRNWKLEIGNSKLELRTPSPVPRDHDVVLCPFSTSSGCIKTIGRFRHQLEKVGQRITLWSSSPAFIGLQGKVYGLDGGTTFPI
jgi:hypothetical protein